MYASVHYTPWTRNNCALFLSFPSALEPQPRNAVSTFHYAFFFLFHRQKGLRRHTHTHTLHWTPSLCSLHNQLPCDTYLCSKWLFAFYSAVFSLYLSLPAMCIIYNYNSHWFKPAMLKPSLQYKIRKQLVRCKGKTWQLRHQGGDEEKKKSLNTSSGRGVTASAQYYDVSKWGACLMTQVPVQISIAPVAATLTAVENHWTLKQIVLLPRSASSHRRSIQVGPAWLTPLSGIMAFLL